MKVFIFAILFLGISCIALAQEQRDQEALIELAPRIAPQIIIEPEIPTYVGELRHDARLLRRQPIIRKGCLTTRGPYYRSMLTGPVSGYSFGTLYFKYAPR